MDKRQVERIAVSHGEGVAYTLKAQLDTTQADINNTRQALRTQLRVLASKIEQAVQELDATEPGAPRAGEVTNLPGNGIFQGNANEVDRLVGELGRLYNQRAALAQIATKLLS
jgi:hypothetical protein